MPAKELTIGLIGLDTSHVPAFAKLLNDKNAPHHVPGGKVVCGCPAVSPDFPPSADRVEKFTAQVRDEYNVEILDTAEAVAERVDLVFITAVDGATHRGHFDRIAKFGKPTFIDKPFATTLADAEAMVAAARQHGTPLMSCSSLRYSDAFTAALADTADGELVGIDVFGPMAMQPPMPPLFWYGVHAVEMIVAAMGVGCRRVQALKNDDFDIVTAEWEDGRMATYRGTRRGHKQFGATLHREKAPTPVPNMAEGRPFYAPMLEAIIKSLPHGRSDVPAEQMLEIVRIIEAANTSRESGAVIALDALSV